MDRELAHSSEDDSRNSTDHDTQAKIQLGKTLRSLRQSRRMTLTVVANKAKITASFLSQIERGLSMPSLPALYRIARVFDYTPSDLLEQESEDLPILTRRHERPRVEARSNFVRERLLPSTVRTMQVFGGNLSAGGTSGDARSHGDSDEILIVVSGAVSVELNDEIFHLSNGDALYYKSSSAHAVHNHGDDEAEVIWVIAPPS